MLIVIPARRNSKGLSFKNRKLLDYTLNKIPEDVLQNTYISTDDEEIIRKTEKVCNIHYRSKQNSQDTSSTLSLMREFKKDLELEEEKNVVMLYLTYPERTFSEVMKIYDFFLQKKLKSLLCKKELKISPFLCMYEAEDGRGRQIIKHDLYRRQDYPKCFEISHYVSIFKLSELDKLNNNMYNDETYFYKIEDKVDVDEKKDLERFLKNDKN